MNIELAKNVPGRVERAQGAVRALAQEGHPFDAGHVWSRMLLNDLDMSERAMNGIIKGAVAEGLIVEIRDQHGPMWVGAQAVSQLDRKRYRLPEEQYNGEVKG